MGSGQSVDIPGGGTEGYHVLRVSVNQLQNKEINFLTHHH